MFYTHLLWEYVNISYIKWEENNKKYAINFFISLQYDF